MVDSEKQQNNPEVVTGVLAMSETEQRMRQYASFLAGLATIGGSLNFVESRNHKNGHVYPSANAWVTFGFDSDKDVDRLVALFGGVKDVKGSSRRGRSCAWRLHHQEALILADVIEPYMHSRQDFVTAARDWENMNSDEKLEVARAFKGRRRRETHQGTSSEAYAWQVDHDDMFLAGLLYGRGTITLTDGKPEAWRKIVIHSINKEVLFALRGGRDIKGQLTTGFGGYVNDGSNGGCQWFFSDREQIARFQSRVEPKLREIMDLAERVRIEQVHEGEK